MDTNDIVEELNELVQLDYDASKTYEQALQNIDEGDADVRADLESFRADHLRHIAELRTVVEEHGGAPIELGRDVKGVLLEGMTKLRSVTGTLGALKAMRMNEKLTNRSYERAAELELPAGARAFVLANLADEQRHLATIEAHIERLRAGADDVADDDVGDDVGAEVGTEDRPKVVAPPEDLHTGVRI
jgi:rubrerythrin